MSRVDIISKGFISWLRRKHHYDRYKIVKSLIKDKGENLLDIGCGSPCNDMPEGAFLRTLGYGTGLDIEPRDIPFKFVLGRIEKLPFKDKSFDAVTAIEVIEHVEDTNVALNELSRVLKDDGTLVITTPNNHLFFKMVWFFWERIIGKEWKHTHVSSYNKKRWLAKIRKNDKFKVIYLKNYWGVNLIMKLKKIK